MHGIGNDFVMVDCVREPVPEGDPAEIARAVCDRRFGVGADGLIYMELLDSPPPTPSPGLGRGEAVFRMRMWNPDGSESEMCGNGVRCMARYLIDEGIVSPPPTPSPQAERGIRIPIETGAGLLVLEDAGEGLVRVDMGLARLTRGEIGMVGPADKTFISQPIGSGTPHPLPLPPPGVQGGGELRGTAVSMGNPHLVVFVGPTPNPLPSNPAQTSEFVERGLLDIDLHRWGPVLERHELFPNRVNVHFVEVVDRGHLVQRTWERGAGATLACGTGACACAVAAFVNGLADRVVDVDLPGGRLRIEYAEDGHVFMTGPATTVFDGEWNL